MMLGLSKLCICLGGKWNLKLKKKNQQRISKMDQEWSHFFWFIPEDNTDLSHRSNNHYPHWFSLFFPVVRNPLTTENANIMHQTSFWLLFAGWILPCRMGTHSISPITQTGNFSKPPSPFDHLTGLICSYQNFWRAMSDVFFWSHCEEVKSLYFKLPAERRRLTHAKWSFQSFQHKKKKGICQWQVRRLFVIPELVKKENIKPTRKVLWKFHYSFFFLKCCAMEWDKSTKKSKLGARVWWQN